MYGSAGFSVLLAPSAVEVLLRRPQQRQVDPQHHDLGLRPWAARPSIQPRRGSRPAGSVSAKNESRRSGPGGGKMSTVAAIEQRPDLALGAAHRGGRGDDLRATSLPSTCRMLQSSSSAVS